MAGLAGIADLTHVRKIEYVINNPNGDNIPMVAVFNELLLNDTQATEILTRELPSGLLLTMTVEKWNRIFCYMGESNKEEDTSDSETINSSNESIKE